MIYRANKINSERRFQLRSGFTLLEIVIVLGLIGVIVAWVSLSNSSINQEKALRQAADQIESPLQIGRIHALAQQKTYHLQLSEKQLILSRVHPSKQEGESQKTDPKIQTDLDEKIHYSIKRWGSSKWNPLLDGNVEDFVITPDGLIEPFSIKYSMDKSWIIHHINPLTAGIREEEMSIEP